MCPDTRFDSRPRCARRLTIEVSTPRQDELRALGPSSLRSSSPRARSSCRPRLLPPVRILQLVTHVPGQKCHPCPRLHSRAYVYRGADVRPVMTITDEGFRDSCGWAFSRIGHFGGPTSLPELLLTTPRWAPTPPPLPEVLRELGRVYVVFR
jgi:hypothetical protein